MRKAATGRRGQSALSMTLAVGGGAALLSAIGALADVGVGMATGGSLSAAPHDAAGRFAQILANPALGLYNLDLLNLVTALVMLPALYASWVVLKREGPAAGLALALSLVGAAVFVANNPALPMLGLALEYPQADAARQGLLAAAGEAILAKGGHGSPGVLPGFLLSSIASIVLSAEMLRTRIFSRVTGLLGLCGNIFLGAYLILVTFLPRVRDLALAFAAPGGLLAIAWMILMSLRLFRLSVQADGAAD